MRSIIAIVIVLLLVGSIAVFFVRQGAKTPESADYSTDTATMQKATSAPAQTTLDRQAAETPSRMVAEYEYDHIAELSDVTAGKAVRGVKTDGKASATVQSGFDDGTYHLFAEFTDLPEPQGTDFYEGWIVRRGANPSVLSTGRLGHAKGAWQNTFTAQRDLSDHDFYVLTIEPDDGDPAPADHILEGVLKQK